MVTETLTKEMVDEGANLLRKLDAQGLDVTAAFWFYLDSSDVWTFIIASPDVQTSGPKRVYSQVQEILGNGATLSLRNLTVLPSDDPLVRLLRSAINTDSKDVGGIRFRRNSVNGQFIEDAYIYRLA